MGGISLKIKHKFLLLIILLVLAVSAANVVTVLRFINAGKEMVLTGVTENLGGLQKTSLDEFSNFSALANDGIRQASGLVAVEQVVAIALNNQAQFTQVVQDEIKVVHGEVDKILKSQEQTVRSGLDDFLANSKNSLNEIVGFSDKSQQLLTNVASFNLDSLTTSSQDSVRRFSLIIQSLNNKLDELRDRNNEELDLLLVQVINQLGDAKTKPGQVIELIMSGFENLKKALEKRKNEIYASVDTDFKLQARVFNEELSLVTRKVNYALNDELDNALFFQKQKTDNILNSLTNKQISIQEKTGKSSKELSQVVNELQTTLPTKLRTKGDEATKKIEEQSVDASKAAEKARANVTAKVQKSTQEATQRFETGVSGTRDVIKSTLSDVLGRTFTYGLIISLICLVLGGVAGVFLVGRILKPISYTVNMLHDIASGEGDLTKRISVQTQDEAGELAKWFNIFVEKLQGVFKMVAENVDKLGRASGMLATVSEEMASSARAVAQQAATLAQNSAQVHNNAESIASATEQLSNNVAVIVAAVEQMTSSISEVARGAGGSAAEANQAAVIASNTSQNVQNLRQGAQSIGKVLEVILDIADQTKLLALNATIEAARAGESGKGFAVVASEVKELAKKTGVSSEDITAKVHEMQTNTAQAVEAIDNIQVVINKVSEMAQTIAAAVQEQSAATNEISQNVSSSAQVADQVSRTSAQSADICREMTTAIGDVSSAAQKTSRSADQVMTTARELTNMAENLHHLIGQFKI